MKPNTVLIIILIVFTFFVIIAGLEISKNYDELENFCESKGGEYRSGTNECYIKEGNYHVKYKMTKIKSGYILME